MPCKRMVSVRGECVNVATDMMNWQSTCYMSDICMALRHCRGVTAASVPVTLPYCAMSANRSTHCCLFTQN